MPSCFVPSFTTENFNMRFVQIEMLPAGRARGDDGEQGGAGFQMWGRR